MSLRGSLQTVALPEVLQFLSGTGKSGAFHVTSGQGEGTVWFVDGRIEAFRAGSAEQAFEAIFELLRLNDGEFHFTAGEDPPEEACRDSDGADVAAAVEAAERRLNEWNEIVEVIPSLDLRVRLVPSLGEDTVILDRSQWALLAAIGDGRSVGQVISACSLREFEGCRAVRDLVTSALIEVDWAPSDSNPVASEVDSLPSEADHVHSEADHVHSEVDQAPSQVDWVPLEGDAISDGAAGNAGEVAVSEHPAGAGGPSPSEAWTEPEEPSLSGDLLRFGVPAGAAADDLGAGQGPGWDAHHAGDGFQPLHASQDGHDDRRAHLNLVAAAPEGEEAQDVQDRYAALRAAIVEVGEQFGDDDAETEPAPPGNVYELGADQELDGRAALQALLNQVTETSGYGYSQEDTAAGPHTSGDNEPVDGLADRGPWTEHELAAIHREGEWEAEGSEGHASIVAFPAAHQEGAGIEGAASVDEPAEQPETAPAGEEPINRGLLLKFLSSVRN